MKSFRRTLNYWLSLIFLGTMGLVIVCYLGGMLYQVVSFEQSFLKPIARAIAAQLATTSAGGNTFSAPVFEKIEESLGLLHATTKLGFAVANTEGRVFYRSANFHTVLNHRFDTEKTGKLFLTGVESGDHFVEFLSRWSFTYRYRQDGYIIYLDHSTEFELVERWMEGMFVAVPVAVLLAFSSGYFLSRKIISPLELISNAVRRVRSGELDARVAPYGVDDEFGRLIDALNETLSELEASFERLQQFSANAAHELKTPLTALRGSLEVCMRRERTSEEYQQVLAGSVEEVAVLSRIVDNLLLLARADTHEIRAHFESLDLSSVVKECVERFGMVEPERRIEAHIDPNLQVCGDRTLLRRLCDNLIHNALKFSPSESPVEVRLFRNQQVLSLEVADQGRGIPPEHQAQIFERFYQLDEGHSQGTGLGLSIVKWICDLHDGKVSLESRLGTGSCFRVELPEDRSSGSA